MKTYDKTYDVTMTFRRKTMTVRVTAPTPQCAMVDALGDAWEAWGDKAMDSTGARITACVEVAA